MTDPRQPKCEKCGFEPCPRQAAQNNPNFICDPQCIECIVIASEPIVECECLDAFKRRKGWMHLPTERYNTHGDNRFKLVLTPYCATPDCDHRRLWVPMRLRTPHGSGPCDPDRFECDGCGATILLGDPHHFLDFPDLTGTQARTIHNAFTMMTSSGDEY